MALELAEKGADIILHYLNSREEAERLADDIRKSGRRCLLTSHDLSKSDSTEKWFRDLIRESGNLDILVNSASEFPEGSYGDLNGADISRSINIHVNSPLIMIRVLHEISEAASVINILDTRIADRDPLHAAYHLGKRGLFTLTKDLAFEMAPKLRINGIAPGVILPPDGKDETWVESLKLSNPMQERGSVKDVADAMMYLIQADFVTGQIIYVDGGRHLKGNAYGL